MASQQMHQRASGFSLPRSYAGLSLRGVLTDVTSIGSSRTSIPNFRQTTFITSDFYEPDGGEHTNAMFMTVVKMLGVSPVPSTADILSLYGSVLAAVYPELKQDIIDVLRVNGIDQNFISLPSGAEGAFITMDTDVPMNKCLVVLGQLIFMSFKNLNTTNYSGFMTKRISAMAAVVGYIVERQNMMVTTNVDTVSKIKTSYGGHTKFRVNLLTRIMEGWELPAPFGNFFSYVAGILKYNDMSSFTFIAESLLYHKSPVLLDPSVQQEVEKLAHAFVAIMVSPYPQFFRIMAKPSVGKLLERANFPTLLTVAQAIKSETYTSVRQFVSPLDVSSDPVVRLIRIHKAHIAATVIPRERAAIRFLSSFAPADTEEDDVAPADRTTRLGNPVIIEEVVGTQ